MPLLRKAAFNPDLTPPHLNGESEVLVLRFTGQLCSSYEDYIKTLLSYRQRQWASSTGRSNLSYEEALTSEHNAKGAPDQLPGPFEACIARLAQHATQRAEELVPWIARHMHHQLVAGEEVTAATTGGMASPCRILAVRELPMPPPVEGEEVPIADAEYEVEWLAGGVAAGATSLLQQSQIERQWTLPTKKVLKRWLQDSAYCEDVQGVKGIPCIWHVAPELVDKFRLQPDVPESITDRVDKAARRRVQRARKGAAAAAAAGRDAAASQRALKAEAAAIAAAAFADAGSTRGDGQAAQASAGGDLEAAAARMPPNSVKGAVFHALRLAGPDGLELGQLVDAVQEANVKKWESSRIARSSVASTCTHDDAFVRVGNNMFALSALCQPDMVPSGEPHSRANQEHGSRAPVARNNFKCPKCHRVTHTEFSPLVLCDNCPRAFHMACLGLEYAQLPEGDWECPKCADKKDAAVRRLLDFELRRTDMTAGEPVGIKRANGDMAGGTDERTAKQRAQQAARRAAMHVDDLDLIEEERRALQHAMQRAAELNAAARRLEAIKPKPAAPKLPVKAPHSRPQTPEAQQPIPEAETAHIADRPAELARGETASAEDRGGSPEAQAQAAKDEEQHEHEPEIAPEREVSPSEPLRQAAAEAQDRVNRLRQIIQGPPKLPAVLKGEEARSSLQDAVAVVEFLATFAPQCDARAMLLGDLQHAVAWPLDAPALPQLYLSLLKCLLQDQVKLGGPGRARAKRWCRLVDDVTWPEILRRYLLASRTYWPLPEADDVTPAALMDDHAIAVAASQALADTPFYKLPWQFHLRLLSALCNDLIEGSALKQEIATRVDGIASLHAGHRALLAEERKAKQEEGRAKKEEVRVKKEEAKHADMPAFELPAELQEFTGDPDSRKALQTWTRKRKDALKALDKQRKAWERQHAKATAERLKDEEAAEQGAQEGQEGPDGEVRDKEEERVARENALEEGLANCVVRTQPLGFDRHFRRYWWFTGEPAALIVEEADGCSVGMLTKPDDLEALMGRLSRRGERERSLLGALKKQHEQLHSQLGCHPVVLDPQLIPRSTEAQDGALQPMEALESSAIRSDVRHAADGLEELLDKLVAGGLGEGLLGGHTEWKRHLRCVDSMQELVEALGRLEAQIGAMIDGLPQGADDATLDGTAPQADEATPMDTSAADGGPAQPLENGSTATAAAVPHDSFTLSAVGPPHAHANGPGLMDMDMHASEHLANGHAPANGPPPLLPSSITAPSRAQPAAIAAQPHAPTGQPHADAQPFPSHPPSPWAQQAQQAQVAPQHMAQQPGAVPHHVPQQSSTVQYSGAQQLPAQQQQMMPHHMQLQQQQQHQQLVSHVQQQQQQQQQAQANGQSQSGAQEERSPGEDDGGEADGVDGDAPVYDPDQDMVAYVVAAEELDNSDEERRRGNPRTALWRSARERAVWRRDLARAVETGLSCGLAFCAGLLVDRTQQFMARMERASEAAQMAAAAQPMPPPPQVPLPVTADGRRVSRSFSKRVSTDGGDLGAGGGNKKARKEAGGKQKGRLKSKASDLSMAAPSEAEETPEAEVEEERADRWDHTCSTCGHEGDLLCCEAPQCTRAMHMSCAGLDDVPMGDWYCPQHARMAKARKASMRSSFSSAHTVPDASLSPRPPPKPASKGPRKKSSARRMPPREPGGTPGPHEPSPSPGSTVEDPVPEAPKLSGVEALAAAVAAGPAARTGGGAKRPRAKRPRS